MKVNGIIQSVVLFHKSTFVVRVEFISDLAPANSALDLFADESGENYFLYSQDSYNNEALRAHRNNNNMISPINKSKRLLLIGPVWGAPTYNISEYILISKSDIVLSEVLLNGK